MIVYIDTCCYGRPTDDQTQRTIAEETKAIMAIIEICQIAEYCIVGSLAVISEIKENRDIIKRDKTKAFYKEIVNTLITTKDDARAKALQAEGLRRMDSHHLAFAEAANADVLLTTDKDFIKVCGKKKLSFVRVINPLNFVKEVIK